MEKLNMYFRIVCCLSSLVGFTALIPLTVLASASCPEVEVLRTGGTVGGQSASLLINLEAGVTGWGKNETRWFNFDTEGGADAMLATALAAIISGKKVQICPKIAGDFSSWSQIGQFYIIK